MAPKKKLAGWGARILEGRTAMLRKAGRKMTQGDLGDAVGVSAQQISRYEAETDEPGYDAWLKMARALLMPPGELVFGNMAEREEELPFLPAVPALSDAEQAASKKPSRRGVRA